MSMEAKATITFAGRYETHYRRGEHRPRKGRGTVASIAADQPAVSDAVALRLMGRSNTARWNTSEVDLMAPARYQQ
jgi:hypothetical protein